MNVVNGLGGWMVLGRGGRGKWYGVVKNFMKEEIEKGFSE